MAVQELTFDRASHTADSIQRAAYRFSDRLSLELIAEDALFRCRLHFLGDDASDVTEVLHAFRIEVLDQVLRERIRNETREVRDVILSLAFAKTNLVEPA